MEDIRCGTLTGSRDEIDVEQILDSGRKKMWNTYGLKGGHYVWNMH